MKGLDYSGFDPELEDELRAMLRRRAAEIRPNPPDWQDLLRRSGAVVVPLHPDRPIDDVPAHGRQPRRHRDWTWLRPGLAAAACLALVMTAGIVVGRSTGSDGSGNGHYDQPDDEVANAEDLATDEPLAAASEPTFNRARAPLVFPAASEAELRAELASDSRSDALDYLADPDQVTQEYLASVGLYDAEPTYRVWTSPTDEGPRTEVGIDAMAVETLTWWWSLREDDASAAPPLIAQGPIYLRNIAVQDAEPAWVVVGAATQTLDVSGVRRRGNQLRFDVTLSIDPWATVDSSGAPVEVTVNGETVDTRTLAVGEPTEIVANAAADEIAAVRVQQVSGFPISILETAFAPGSETPPSDPDAVIPSTVLENGFATASLSEECGPDADLLVSLDLPDGFVVPPARSGSVCWRSPDW